MSLSLFLHFAHLRKDTPFALRLYTPEVRFSAFYFIEFEVVDRFVE
jgi:hypothetical protein